MTGLQTLSGSRAVANVPATVRLKAVKREMVELLHEESRALMRVDQSTSFEQAGREFWTEMDALGEMLYGVVAEEAADV